jgi:hypothetical protein
MMRPTEEPEMRKLLAATALAGSIGAGLVLSPAAAQAATTATQAQAVQTLPRHSYSYNDRHSNFTGYWYKRDNRYYFGGDLYERDHKPNYYSYVWVKWYDSSGFHKTYYRTSNHRHVHFGDRRFKRDLDYRVCWGTTPDSGCSNWKDVF